jgi:HSP20 family protein
MAFVPPKETAEVWFWQIGTKMTRLSDQAIQGLVAAAGVSRRAWKPHADVIETHRDVEIRVELAGVEPGDIFLNYSDDQKLLTIRGRRVADCSDPHGRCHQIEVLNGEFERDFHLPDVEIERDGIKAKFVNGMLLVSLPKREKLAGRRKVSVTRG